MKRCVVTVAATNSLHAARALLRAVGDHHPETDRACVVVARDTHEADALREGFDVVPVAALGLPDGDDVLFGHDIPELFAALQPWIVEYFFSRGHDGVVFLAPHLRLERPLVEAFRALETSAEVVVVPNVTPSPATATTSGSPPPAPADLPWLGGVSADFLAMRRTERTRRALDWWREGLRRCDDVPRDASGAVDPRWHDLLPVLCERTVILRHPGYNVASWNLADRSVRLGADGRFLAGEEPLVYWNLGGLEPDAPERLSSAPPTVVASDLFRRVMAEQARKLRELGAAWYGGQPYDFGFFDDGGRVSPAERRRFRRDAALRRACGGRPFARPDLARLVCDDATAEGSLAPSFRALGENRRLDSLCEQLLGRPATPAERRAWRPRLGTAPGRARLLLTVGLSREARRTPGWLARLLRYVAQAPTARRSFPHRAVTPLIGLLALAARVFPSLAYRPCTGDGETAAPEPHPRHARGYAAGPQSVETASRETAAVDILGYFGRELGIGEAARSLARSCEAAGITVNTVDVGGIFEAAARTAAAAPLPRRRQLPIDILCYNADMTPAAARHLRALGRRSGYRIGFWHWEQPVLPRRFHEAFAELDEVWVPSRFVHDAIAPVSPVPVVTIPHAVDFAPTDGVRRADFGLPEDKRLVLVMYDFHSFQERKNPRAAVAAFRAAKAAEPSLGLVIKTINAGHHRRERQELEETLRDVPDVTIIDSALTRQQAWDLEACCDILLSLHRAEGFGLILAEMMFLGKPVVATGWSANMDFMDESNSVPVAFTLAPLPRPVGPYEAGVPWAEPDVDHAAAALRRLAADRDLAARLGRAAGVSIRRTLAPEVVGGRVRERLDVIRRWCPRAGAEPPPAGGEGDPPRSASREPGVPTTASGMTRGDASTPAARPR